MDALIDRVFARGGFPTRSQAERAVEAALETLGETLSADDAVRLGSRLRDHDRDTLLRRADPADLDRDELVARIASRERTTLSRAIEHAEIVFVELGALADEVVRTHLRTRLHPEIAAMFEPGASSDADAISEPDEED